MLFYRDKLGFKLNDQDDESALLAIGGKGGPVLGLISVDSVAKLISEKQVRRRKETIHRTYYAIFVDDVDREYE